MGNIFAQNSFDSVVPKECDHKYYIKSLLPNNTCPNMFCFIDMKWLLCSLCIEKYLFIFTTMHGLQCCLVLKQSFYLS